MIILENCRVLHMPRTGGKWRKACLDLNGIRYKQCSPKHQFMDQALFPNLHAIVYVRNPFEWFRSYVGWKLANQWGSKVPWFDRLDAFIQADSLPAAIDRYLDQSSISISEMYDAYTQPSGEVTVLHMERMYRSFSYLMSLVSSKFALVGDRVNSLPAVECDDEHREMFCNRHESLINRFGY